MAERSGDTAFRCVTPFSIESQSGVASSLYHRTPKITRANGSSTRNEEICLTPDQELSRTSYAAQVVL
jgi:hypothetical protein